MVVPVKVSKPTLFEILKNSPKLGQPSEPSRDPGFVPLVQQLVFKKNGVTLNHLQIKLILKSSPDVFPENFCRKKYKRLMGPQKKVYKEFLSLSTNRIPRPMVVEVITNVIKTAVILKGM